MVGDGSTWHQRSVSAGWTHVGREDGRTVVWVRGQHDAATSTALSQSLRGAAALDDGDLIVDLSGVDLMGGATVDVLVSTRAMLWRRLQLLALRAPSRSARLVLDLCAVAYADGLDAFDIKASSTALGMGGG